MILITSVLTIIALITLLNALTFPRLKSNLPLSHARNEQWRGGWGVRLPFVSVMIPARNEAAVIGETLSKLLAQDYPNFEILLLDDNSTDDTARIARSFRDSRLKALSGQPLPPGWMGKNWACHQMAAVARGDILLFTDADVRWSPAALSALITEMQRTDADLFTVWPTQRTATPAERLVVPMMALVVIGYLPVIAVHHIPSGGFAAANGQCMVWRREAYRRVGGHESVSDNVLEDVTLARRVKSQGMRLRMADGAGLISCRMYHDWQSVRDGYAKNILAGYGGRILFLALATIFHWSIFLLPWLILLTAPRWGLAMIALGLGVRLLTAAVTRQRILDGLLMPVSVILMTLIAARAMEWHIRYGGPQWKGRTITNMKSSSSARESVV